MIKDCEVIMDLNLYSKKREFLFNLSGIDFILAGSFNNLIHNPNYGRLPGDIDLLVPSYDQFEAIYDTIEDNPRIEVIKQNELSSNIKMKLSDAGDEFGVDVSIGCVPFEPNILPSIFGEEPQALKAINHNFYMATKLYTYLVGYHDPEYFIPKDLFDLMVLIKTDFDVSGVKHCLMLLEKNQGKLDQINMLSEEDNLPYLEKTRRAKLEKFGNQKIITSQNTLLVKKLINKMYY